MPMRRSRMEHGNTRTGLLSAWSFAGRDVIGSYNGALVYADVDRELQSRKRYGERYLVCTATDMTALKTVLGMKAFQAWS